MTKHCLHLTIIVVIFAVAASLHGQAASPEDVAITAVAGESWLRHLHTTFNETRMGRTWNLGQGGMQLEVEGLTPRETVRVSLRLPGSTVVIDASATVVLGKGRPARRSVLPRRPQTARGKPQIYH